MKLLSLKTTGNSTFRRRLHVSGRSLVINAWGRRGRGFRTPVTTHLKKTLKSSLFSYATWWQNFCHKHSQNLKTFFIWDFKGHWIVVGVVRSNWWRSSSEVTGLQKRRIIPLIEFLETQKTNQFLFLRTRLFTNRHRITRTWTHNLHEQYFQTTNTTSNKFKEERNFKVQENPEILSLLKRADHCTTAPPKDQHFTTFYF